MLSFFRRLGFSLFCAVRYSKEIRVSTNDFTATSVLQLDLKAVQRTGIKVLVLDFDGVLAPHGELYPADAVLSWIKDAVAVFGHQKVIILSNKPSKARAMAMAHVLPESAWHFAVKKKPYPDGLLSICKAQHAQRNEVLLIDDRILTGVLATVLSGTKACLILQPMQNYQKRPLIELFFASLRLIERSLFISNKR